MFAPTDDAFAAYLEQAGGPPGTRVHPVGTPRNTRSRYKPDTCFVVGGPETDRQQLVRLPRELPRNCNSKTDTFQVLSCQLSRHTALSHLLRTTCI